MSADASALSASFKVDAQVISLVGFAHGVSHFFHLMLPPLFPWLIAEFNLKFAEVGALTTVFFVVSAIGQALAGIWVDRFGAFRVLCCGIGVLSLSGLMVFVSPGFSGLWVAAALAGMGNSVFHPADFTLLNRRVSVSRLGHAFSVHGLTGNLGWASAPVMMTALATAFGWRIAGLGAAMVGALALVLLVWNRERLQYELQPMARASHGAGGAGGRVSVGALLRSRMVWLAFGFFFFSTFSLGALQNFAPTLLQEMYGLSLTLATSTLSIYLVSGSVGLLLGGFLLQERKSFEYLIAASLFSGVVIALVLAWVKVPVAMVTPLMAVMGFGVGIAGPSRDMLVRTATKARLGEAAFGRVYGMVYSGLDAGLAIAPVLFGLMLDARRYDAVFAGIGAALACAILAAMSLGREGRR